MLFDIDYGMYLFVMFSNCVVGNVVVGVGVGLGQLYYIFGIIKVYCMCVGFGLFLSELYDVDNLVCQDLIGVCLVNVGKEFGLVIGWLCCMGWLDVVVLCWVIQINGVLGFCMIKFDVLDGLEMFKLCVGYMFDGKEIDILLCGFDVVVCCQLIYEEFLGWNILIFGLKEWDVLFEIVQVYLKCVEEVVGILIVMIFIGFDCDEIILLCYFYKD